MAVGNQATAAGINSMLSALAIELRNTCQAIRQQNTFMATLGQAGLVNAGFASTDAATAEQLMGFMNNIAAVYFGTGTQATASNFDQALSVLWGGQ